MIAEASPCSPDIQSLEADVASSEAERRVRAIYHPQLPDHLCRVLAGDELASIRSALLRRSDLGADLVFQLSRDHDPRVRREVAGRSLPISNAVREGLSRDPVSSVRERLAGRPDLDADTTARLAGDEHPFVRAMIVSRPDLPEPILGRLCADDDSLVRRHAAARADLPPHLVTQMAGDEHEMVRATIARNPFLNDETARLLGQDPSPRVRGTIADSHPHAASARRGR